MPVGPGRTADLVADYRGLRWAVELRSSSRPLRADAAFEPAGPAPLPYPTVEAYFSLCWREKGAQLAATMAAERCERGLLLVCADGPGGEPWERALARAYVEARPPAGVHFGLLGGAGLTLVPAA